MVAFFLLYEFRRVLFRSEGEILPSAGAEIYLRPDIALEPIRTYVWEGVTDAVESEVRDSVCYGQVVIKKEFAKAGTEIFIKVRNRLLKAVTVKMPFYKPE